MNIKFEANCPIIKEAIAVIGMAGRFPGAKDITEFWQILRDGKDVIRHFSDAELKQAGIQEELISNPHYIKARGVLNDIEYFDANFFGISPYEAAITDPQHRLFLEICWEGLETAGYTSDKYDGLIGVFAGMSDSTYLENNLLKNDDFIKTNYAYQTQIATSIHFLATKVAYHLNLKGPCLNINTACSTSLVTIIKACQSLQINECDIAIAGGVSFRVPQIKGYLYREGGIFSSDGRCRAFDKDATGTVSSGAAGVVILKRLSDAIRDGDRIEAIIKSFAINNDGASKVGYAAPSVLEQSRCIATALSTIDNVESVSYIEAHGTGTTLGDPIEIAALTKAFRYYSQKNNFCAIGSVKTNIGHADAAAGVVGFIKTILALKHKLIPASLHFKQPNPRIQLSDSPFFINQELCEWHSEYPIRRAGVSSFGIGGTNAHVILEEAPNKKSSSTSRPTQIISLSARTEIALSKLEENLLDYLEHHHIEENDLANIAYTLHIGRKEFAYRKSYLGTDKQQIIALLKNASKVFNTNIPNKRPKLVFLFSSRGALFSGMAKAIYENEPVFREHLEQAADYLEPEHRERVLKYITDTQAFIYPNDVCAYIQQSALFILEYGLAKTLIVWGIKPDALFGCGVGEYVAAYFAGVLSLQDAIQLVLIQGQLIDTLESGMMLSILPSAEKIEQKFINQSVAIAAINAFIEIVGKILQLYKETLTAIKFQPLKIPYLSSITGNWINEQDLLDANYFAEYFRKKLLFSEGLSFLIKEGYNAFIEIGIDHVLTTDVNGQNFKEPLVLIKTLPDKDKFLSNYHSQSQALQNTLMMCWSNHIPVNWHIYYLNETRLRVSLPIYPFQKTRHWIEPSKPLHKDLNKLNLPAIFQPYWEAAKYPEAIDFSQSKNWLLFSDSIGVSNQLLQYLFNHSQKAILITRGSNFEQINVHNYQINPESAADYKKLFNILHETHSLPDYILHCWSLGDIDSPDMLSLSDDIQTNGFLSLVYLAQAFLEHIRRRPLQITIITNYLKSVLPEDHIIPDKATLLGACLVIPQEYPQVSCRVIDTDIIDLCTLDRDRCLSHLINEANNHHKNNTIAYRRGIRFINRFRECQDKQTTNENSYFKKGGIYFITGGLGKIGIRLAEFLAERYSANLILLGHTHVPSKAEDSTAIFKSGQSESYKELILKLENIKKSASSLLLLQADVSDYHHMDVVFTEIKAKYQTLDGIFHLAGIADQTSRVLIKDISIEQVTRLFLPKIQGTKVIQCLIDKMPVGFCLLYSSLASIAGGISLASYAASNCYLDSMVDYQKNNYKTRWISINWDAWDFSEENKQNISSSSQSYNKLQPSDAEKLLIRCVDNLESNEKFIISATDLNERLEKWINPTNTLLPVDVTTDPSSLKINNNFDADVNNKLKGIFQECLGISNFSDEDNFYDIGGDSISAIRLLEMLEKTFLIRIKLSDLVVNNSVSKLVKIIQSQHHVSAHSCLIKIKEVGNGLPLFLIHPVGGFIFCYLELAKYLPVNHPCYAIQDPNIDSDQVRFENIEEMAGYYLEQIQTIQPTGPYFIGGYSLGANIAFEISRQLSEKKMELGGVFLIDGWAAFSSHLKSYDRFCYSMQRTLNELDNNIPDGISNKKRVLDLAWQRMGLLFNYVPSVTNDISLVLFKAQDILPEYMEVNDITNHWQHYVTKPIDAHYIQGTHATMLKGIGAQQIGKMISDYIHRLIN